MDKFKYVIEINSNSDSNNCRICNKQVTICDGLDMGEMINHYIQHHNYKLLSIMPFTFDCSHSDTGFVNGVKAYVESEPKQPETNSYR